MAQTLGDSHEPAADRVEHRLAFHPALDGERKGCRPLHSRNHGNRRPSSIRPVTDPDRQTGRQNRIEYQTQGIESVVTETDKSMRTDVWLVCFRYGFGNWQFMESFTKQAEKNGATVRLVLSNHLRWMADDLSDRAIYLTWSDGFISMIFDTCSARLWSMPDLFWSL